jgi:hypothetical protein
MLLSADIGAKAAAMILGCSKINYFKMIKRKRELLQLSLTKKVSKAIYH